MRLKVQCLTRVENQYIGFLANGTRASTVAAPPHPLASGEQVSIWGRWAEQRGAWPEPPLPPAGGPQRPFSISSLPLNYARATGSSVIHLVISQTHPHAYQQYLCWAGKVLGSESQNKAIAYRWLHIIPLSIPGTQETILVKYKTSFWR